YDYDQAMVENDQERFYCNWSLFKVENSQYIQWFVKQNIDVCNDINILHYSIFTLHNLIEVLIPEDSIITAMWN
ncbi:MAG: hypothetical protein AAF652_10910, partial [Cyanobacteria bacterium P01_C01_bin.72]